VELSGQISARLPSDFPPPDAGTRGSGRYGQGRGVTAEAAGRPFVHVTSDDRDQVGMGRDSRGACAATCKIAGIAYTGSNPVPATVPLSCGNRRSAASLMPPGRSPGSLHFPSARRAADTAHPWPAVQSNAPSTGPLDANDQPGVGPAMLGVTAQGTAMRGVRIATSVRPQVVERLRTACTEAPLTPRDQPLEVDVVQRVVLGRHGQAFVLGVGGWPLRDRPRLEHARHL
jgi:hypothetical protein